MRVLIVDDDPLVRAALTMMLDGAPGIAPGSLKLAGRIVRWWRSGVQAGAPLA